MKIVKQCKVCEQEFTIPYKSDDYKQTCSKKCGYRWRSINSPNTKKQMAGLAKGRGWNKGLKGRQEWHNTTGLRPPRKGERLGINTGKDNKQWKGDDVGYMALHSWVSRHFGKPSECEMCDTKTAKRFEWANISGEYKREREDFMRLCKKCHNNYDSVNAWQNKARALRAGIAGK